MDARLILRRAGLYFAGSYDRNATGEVRRNTTTAFHLCGLIERAATTPKSGSTHRRYAEGAEIQEAKALFCKAHKVAHPGVWEWESNRTCEEVRAALLHAYAAEER